MIEGWPLVARGAKVSHPPNHSRVPHSAASTSVELLAPSPGWPAPTCPPPRPMYGACDSRENGKPGGRGGLTLLPTSRVILLGREERRSTPEIQPDDGQLGQMGRLMSMDATVGITKLSYKPPPLHSLQASNSTIDGWCEMRCSWYSSSAVRAVVFGAPCSNKDPQVNWEGGGWRGAKGGRGMGEGARGGGLASL